jgi:hydrogenase maturation protein HypF
MQLEWLASEAEADIGYPHEITESDGRFLIDTRPIVSGAFSDVRAGRAPAIIARRFHAALADAVVAACLRVRTRTGIEAVVLTGGVFLNAILTADCESRLSHAAFRVFTHHTVPPGDGGVSLGQLAVAAARSQTTCA